MTYSIDWLLQQYADGNLPKYLFFWGHQAGTAGGLSASCLSQWWPCEFTVGTTVYRSAEHWMMAAKARLFEDHQTEALILDAASPAEAKQLGRAVQGFQPDVWDREKYHVVIEGNLYKFGQNSSLCEYLLGSRNRVIVEASPVDAIWGIGLGASDPRSMQPDKWRGANLLGFALMEVRDKLLSERRKA